MTGTPERRAIDPSSLESKRVELFAQDIPDLPDSSEVHRTTVDVDKALEKSGFGLFKKK